MASMDLKDIIELAYNCASILAICAAAGWFIYSTQHKPRIQFDLDCQFITLNENQDRILAEIQFIFENKGFVEHRIWELYVSVHTLSVESSFEYNDLNKGVKFSKLIFPKTQLVPKQYEYYFVRPGVRQIISHTIEIPSNISAIRITSSFNYNKNRDRAKKNTDKVDNVMHTARRLFHLPKSN